jgi:hypothetical protein
VNITTSNLIRWAGVAAVLGGLIFAARIHPPDTLAGVSSSEWVIVHAVGVGMSFLVMLGLVGIYARQAARAGWMGLAGFLLLEVMWLLTAGFQFAEALVVPLLLTDAPQFVEGWLGLVTGSGSQANVGALAAVNSATSLCYLLGGVLLGVATFRAGILPRWAGVALAVGTVAPLAFALLPHEFIRVAAVPFGLALAGLGYALWSEPRAPASQPVPAKGRVELRQAAAE